MASLIAAAALAALAAILATLLLYANRRLAVVEDPRLAAVETALPGINCGACGYPACRAFAEALLAGQAAPAACSVSSPDTRARIAAFLGVAVGTAQRLVARLACAGGRNRAPFRVHYRGESSCAAAAAVGGGGKACMWGCLNFGDCERACDFAAIRLDAHGLPVVDEALCTACGDCVSACPKDLFTLTPEAQPLWVACRNPELGNQLLEICSVACTGCGKCAQDAPALLQMQQNLPRLVDSAVSPTRTAIERCPTGAIVWIEDGQYQPGSAAARPTRQADLPPRPG